MAKRIYDVQAPDGSILEIEGPEGASQEQLVEAARQHFEAQKAQKPSKPAPEITTAQRIGIHAGAIRDTLLDTSRLRHVGDALRSTAMGAGDLVLGAGQLASKFMGEEQAQRYADAMRWVEQGYQEGRENPQNPDIARFTGSVAAGGAATGAAVGGAAPTLLGRMVQGGQMGGALGLVSPVDPAQANFWTQKAVQTGGGAALGFLAPAVVEGVVRGAGAAANYVANQVRGMKARITGQAGARTVEIALSSEIPDWAKLPEQFRASLVAEVQKSVRAGGKLDPEAIRRLTDFNKAGVTPTQGQLSRDPLLFAREQNYRGAEFGRPLAERFNQQNQQLIGAVDDLRTGTGARGADPYAAGQRVISDLRATDAATKAKVDTAYTQARSLAGLDSEVPAAPVADRLGKIVEDFGDDKIPGVVMKRLQEFGLMGGKQTKSFTIREAEKLKTLVGNSIENPNNPTGKALTLLKNSVDDAMNSIGDDAGAQAAGAFQQARGLAARRFEALRKTPGMEKAIGRDPGAPEKFLESEIIRGDIKDVANLMMRLKSDARAEVRGATLDWIRGKGVSGVADTEQFNQAGFNKALQTIGERKLKLIFAGDKEALRHIEALGRVGAYIQKPPVGSAVNFSNTMTSGLDFLDQFVRTATLGLPFKPGDVVRGLQVGDAIGAVSPTQAARNVLPPALIDQIAKLGGMGAVPIASTAGQGVLEQPTKKLIKGALYR